MQALPINPNIRTELIEITVANIGAVEFPLGSLPNLRNAGKIIQIEAFNVAQIPVSPSGKVTINAAVFVKAFLRLINRDNTELRALPLTGISKSVNGTTIPRIDCGKIDPEKSKICVGSTAGLAQNEVFILQVTYEQGQGPK